MEWSDLSRPRTHPAPVAQSSETLASSILPSHPTDRHPEIEAEQVLKRPQADMADTWYDWLEKLDEYLTRLEAPELALRALQKKAALAPLKVELNWLEGELSQLVISITNDLPKEKQSSAWGRLDLLPARIALVRHRLGG